MEGQRKVLAQLKMEFENDFLNYKMSSNLQGVIYEKIDSDYVEEMHKNQLHPYSQCLLKEDNKAVWCIKTITKEAYEKIILPLQDTEFQSFEIKNGTHPCKIQKKMLLTETREDLLREFYDKDGGKYINLEFQTPTSFKQNGRNVIFPDIRLIYQSLMNKYSAYSETVEMYDEDTLEQLIQNSEIVHYNLKSINFPMEGVKIPGFKGKITIRLNGPDTMSRYVRMLCRFGEYSGIGMKTAMGMGAIRIVEWRQ